MRNADRFLARVQLSAARTERRRRSGGGGSGGDVCCSRLWRERAHAQTAKIETRFYCSHREQTKRVATNRGGNRRKGLLRARADL